MRLSFGLFLAVLAMLSVSACGKEDNDDEKSCSTCSSSDGRPALGEPASTPLAGTINNAAWTFTVGSAKPSRFEGEADTWFSIDLFGGELENDWMTGEPSNVCDFMVRSKDGRHVMGNIPRQVGEYRLGPYGDDPTIRTATFTYRKDDGELKNYATDNGQFFIEEITDTKVVARMVLNAEDDKKGVVNHIDGRFELDRCPEEG